MMVEHDLCVLARQDGRNQVESPVAKSRIDDTSSPAVPVSIKWPKKDRWRGE